MEENREKRKNPCFGGLSVICCTLPVHGTRVRYLCLDLLWCDRVNRTNSVRMTFPHQKCLDNFLSKNKEKQVLQIFCFPRMFEEGEQLEEFVLT